MVMTEKIYKQIARKYGVTVDEVKSDMQAAVDMTYVNPNFYARCVYYKGENPTTEEFVSHIVRRELAGENNVLSGADD